MNYYSLNVTEKKSLRINYFNTKKGAEMKKMFFKLILEGILCLIIGIYFVVSTIITKGDWWNYFLAGALFISGFTFLIGQYVVRIKEYNKFFVKGKK